MIALSVAIAMAAPTTPGFAADTGYAPWFQQAEKTVCGSLDYSVDRTVGFDDRNRMIIMLALSALRAAPGMSG